MVSLKNTTNPAKNMQWWKNWKIADCVLQRLMKAHQYLHRHRNGHASLIIFFLINFLDQKNRSAHDINDVQVTSNGGYQIIVSLIDRERSSGGWQGNQGAFPTSLNKAKCLFKASLSIENSHGGDTSLFMVESRVAGVLWWSTMLHIWRVQQLLYIMLKQEGLYIGLWINRPGQWWYILCILLTSKFLPRIKSHYFSEPCYIFLPLRVWFLSVFATRPWCGQGYTPPGRRQTLHEIAVEVTVLRANPHALVCPTWRAWFWLHHGHNRGNIPLVRGIARHSFTWGISLVCLALYLFWISDHTQSLYS